MVVELLWREATLMAYPIDMLDRSPIVDIKPCQSSIPMLQVRRGWLEASLNARGGGES